VPGPDPDPHGGRHTLSCDDPEFVEAVAAAARLRIDAFERVEDGKSSDLVFRLEGERAAFAKASGDRPSGRAEFDRERAALSWLDGRFAPRLIWAGEVLDRAVIVSDAVPGLPLHQARDPEAGAVAALRTLSSLHSLGACPFDARLAVKLEQARKRTAAGEVDEGDFQPEYAGRSAADLLTELLGRTPSSEDLVVAHGDACWPNFIIRPGGDAAIVDLGRFGVADRHQDLALFLRSAAFNAPGLDARALVEAHYRLAPLDDRKLEFYRMLDEFF